MNHDVIKSRHGMSVIEGLFHALMIVCTVGMWYPVYRLRKTPPTEPRPPTCSDSGYTGQELTGTAGHPPGTCTDCEVCEWMRHGAACSAASH